MEELLVVIFQFMFELLLQVLVEVPWDVFLGARDARSEGTSSTAFWIIGSLLAGGGIGGISLMLFPTTMLHRGSARMANLLVAPAVSALTSLYLSRRGAGKAGRSADPSLRAICAACFTFSLALARFTYATRP